MRNHRSATYIYLCLNSVRCIAKYVGTNAVIFDGYTWLMGEWFMSI